MSITREELENLARELAARYLSSRCGIPKHKLLAELSHRRSLVKDLLDAEFIRWHGTTAFPAFRAFELLPSHERDTCRHLLSIVLNGLKLHFSESGPTQATVGQLLACLNDAKTKHIDAELGMHIAAEFLYFVKNHGTADDGQVVTLTPKEEILDFTNVEEAWQLELKRRLEQRNLNHIEPELNLSSAARPVQMDFTFVTDERLRSIIQRDYDELQKVKGANATLSRIILCGRIIEALLLDAMLRNPSKANAAKNTPKEKGKPMPCENWSLNDLLEVAIELGFVRAGHEKQSHGVREFRNLVHPGWELRSGLSVQDPEANIAEEFLRIVLRDLPVLSK
jgi:hypothetical protein